MTPRKPGLLLLAVVATATLAVALFSCAPDARFVARIAPGIDPEMARHLVRDDDAAFRRYCRTVGPIKIKGAMGCLESDYDRRSPERFARSWAVAHPYFERLAGALATEFDTPGYLRNYRYYAGRTAAQRRALWALD